jgi:hypothetical protein
LVHTNLVVGHVDHHEWHEAEKAAAKDDEHHAGLVAGNPVSGASPTCSSCPAFSPISSPEHWPDAMLFQSVVANSRSGAKFNLTNF